MTLSSNQPLNANLRVAESALSGATKYREVGSKIFNPHDPQRITEIFALNTGMGLLPQVSENASYPQVDLNEFANKQVTQQVFKKELPYSMLMKRFDNHAVIAREAARAGYRMMQTKDNLMASIFRGYATTTTVAGGATLGSATQMIGTTGLTQSNLVTGGFSETNLQVAIQSLYEQRDHDNVIGALDAVMLVFPAGRYFDSFKFLRSTGSPTTANRYLNPLSQDPNIVEPGQIELVPWGFLGAVAGGVDTTAFLLSEKLFHQLFYLESIAPKMTPRTSSETLTGGESYRFDYAAAAVAADYRGLVVITA
jgi:hypothetical protein